MVKFLTVNLHFEFLPSIILEQNDLIAVIEVFQPNYFTKDIKVSLPHFINVYNLFWVLRNSRNSIVNHKLLEVFS